MHKLDPQTLFSIFEQGDEMIYKEHGVEDALENPYVLMGMVLRGMENYHIMDAMYTKQYPKQYKKVKKMVQYKYFNKLYSYLTRIEKVTLESIFRIGESFEKGSVFLSLDNFSSLSWLLLLLCVLLWFFVFYLYVTLLCLCMEVHVV